MAAKDWVRVEAYMKPGSKSIIVVGDEVGPKHDCDEMGCTSVSHVLARGYVDRVVFKGPSEKSCTNCGATKNKTHYAYPCKGCDLSQAPVNWKPIANDGQ